MPFNHVFDRLPSGSLDRFHDFREKAYPNAYFCRTCVRAFDSRTPLDACKFCGSAIMEMVSARKENPALKKIDNYRHYCPACERSFMSREKTKVCPNCNTDYVHVYKWDTTRRRDRIMMNLRNAFVKPAKPPAPRKQFTLFQRRPDEELPTY